MRTLFSDAAGASIALPIPPEQSRSEVLPQFSALPLQRAELNGSARLLKRSFDVILSLCALLVFGLPMLAIAALIRLDSPGPVFYRSKRIGLRGRMFVCTKFRIFVEGGSAGDDSHFTRVGGILRAFSLHNLPQFFDVLRGDMSIVGPRPPLAADEFNGGSSNLRRFDLSPGMTGLSRVQAVEPHGYISMDSAYVQNWSVWRDMEILLRTFAGALTGH